MSYSDFTLRDVKQKFQLTIDENSDLFSEANEVTLSDWLKETLQETLTLVLSVNTEKVRSELLIAPVLVELRKIVNRRISLFSGVDFNVDAAQGLNGFCDFIVSLSSEQMFINAPVLIAVEAKNENIKSGLAQCIATMVAAQLFNEREGNRIPAIYGVVTTGTTWRFLKLEAATVFIDSREYYIDNIEKILGILVQIVQQ